LLNSFLHFMDKHNLEFSLLKYNTNLYEQSDYFYIICFLILFVLATISFFLFESPINRVKKYFNYS
jgi:peptidoglycan/LPS O-acetylase OafA/YrhL